MAIQSEKIIASPKNYEFWLKKNWYYHGFLASFYSFIIPKGLKVLQLGCKAGHLLGAAKPSYGVGIDENPVDIAIAQEKFPDIHFRALSFKDFSDDQKFDYIILSSTTMEVYDIQELFEKLQQFCHEGTKIVIDSYSNFWEPVLWLTAKLGLRRGTPLKNWISRKDLKNFLSLADYQVITQGRQLLLPCYIPIFSWLINGFIAPLPIINWLCLSEWLIARPKPQKKSMDDYSVSVIIPCRNEKGNIEPAIKRCPEMGRATEFIFVEGNSKDNTLTEIKRVKEAYPDKDIKYLVQDGKGKGDAVRKGFAHASGDILMILDADLTTPPEEMPKFVKALVNGHGEFINGSRLIYGMEDEAMRIPNLIANFGFGVGFSWLLGQRIKDTLCGTKVLFKKDYEKIVANRAFFGDFDPFGDFDLLFGAAKQNLKIIDLPVHYKNRTYGTTQIKRWRSGVMLAYMSWIAFIKFKLHSFKKL